MKILYFNPDRGIPVLGDKGASVHVREFVAAAAALGHEVVLVCATLGSGNASPAVRILHLAVPTHEEVLLKACRKCNVEVEHLENSVARRELTLLAYDQDLAGRVLIDLAQTGFQPDLVYERHALFSSAGAKIAAVLSIPRILEVNAPLVAEQTQFRSLFLTQLAREMEAESYSKADVVVAVSEAVAAHVRSVTTLPRLRVVANGVDTLRFNCTDRRGAIRMQLGLGEEAVIGFIGSFKVWHGVDTLLDAFDIVRRKHPTAKLIALGDGPELAALRARAASSAYAHQLIFPGRVSHFDIPEWLAAMDLTVAPYRPQEPFYFSPLKIVESLAAARPVVAPRIGQVAELVSHGNRGLLYPPGSVSGCAAAIGALLDEPARRIDMGNAGRRFAAGQDWRTIVARVLAYVEPHVSEPLV